MSVHFGTLDTYKDLGLQLVDEDLGFPSLQRATVEVMGRDGDIDLTGMIDTNPHFGNRTAKWKFAMIHGQTPYWYTVVTELMSRIHGRTLDIVTDSEPEFTMQGCVQVKSFDKFQSPGYVEIEADCQPYRIFDKGSESDDWKWSPFNFISGQTFYRNWSGEEAGVTYEGELKNLGSKTEHMLITTTQDVSFTIDGESWNLAAGGRHSALYISPGVTPFTYSFRTTPGTLTFSYQMEVL